MGTPNAQAETDTSDDGGNPVIPDDFDLPLTEPNASTEADDEEGEEQPAAAAKAPAKVEAKEEPQESDLDKLRKKREERRKLLDAERARVDAHSRAKELETRVRELDELNALKSSGKKLEVLKRLGIELSDVIGEHLESMEVATEQGEAPSTADKATLKRLEALEAELKGKKDAEEAAAKEADERRKAEASNAAVSGAIAKAKDLLTKGGERFEVINAYEAHAEVFNEFSQYCKDHKLQFTAEDEGEAEELFLAFAERADETMAERAAAAARTKKVQTRLDAKPAAAKTAAGGEAKTPTAKGRGHVAPPVESTDDDELEQEWDPRKRAKLLSRSFRISE